MLRTILIFFRKETSETPPPPNHRMKMAADHVRHPMGVKFLPCKPLNPPPKGSTFG